MENNDRSSGCLIEAMCAGDFTPVICPPTPACELCNAPVCDYYR